MGFCSGRGEKWEKCGNDCNNKIIVLYTYFFLHRQKGGVAQMVERAFRIREVTGSMPVSSSFFGRTFDFWLSDIFTKEMIEGYQQKNHFLSDLRQNGTRT